MTIDPDSGIISIADPTIFDHETNPTLTITASVTDSTNLSDTATFTVSILDIHQSPTVNVQTPQVPENQGTDLVSGTLTGDDPEFNDGDRIGSWSLPDADFNNDGTDDFTIDPDTGELTYIGGGVDFETETTTGTITAQVQDTDGHTGSADIQIQITDINEAPTFVDNHDDTNHVTSNNYVEFFQFYDEQLNTGDAIGTITGTDPDVASTITYTYLGMVGDYDDASPFVQIDPDTGEISVLNAEWSDYDNRTSGITLTTGEVAWGYELRLQIDDGEFTDTADVFVNILPFEFIPVINDQTINVDEFTPANTTIGSVTWSDPDTANGETHTFEITSGGDGLVSINPDTGELTLLADNLDINDNATHTFTVRVTSNEAGTSDSATVTLAVQDVGEAPTVTATDATIGENPLDGRTIPGITFSITDPDLNESYTYAITNQSLAGDPYEIDTDTAAITVRDGSILDYEDPDAQSVTLTIQVTDKFNLTATTDVTINLIDFTNTPIGYTGESFGGFSINSQTGDQLSGILAQDDDTANGDRLTYFIRHADNSEGQTTLGGALAIDADSGRITIADDSRLDTATAPTFTYSNRDYYGWEFDAYVRDTEGGESGPQTYYRYLTDFNIDPADVDDNQSFSVSEAAIAGTTFGTVQATTQELNQTFAITAGNDDSIFAIDSDAGELSVVRDHKLDYETNPQHTLTVQLGDDQDPGNADTTTVTINITDDTRPDITILKTVQTIREAGGVIAPGEEVFFMYIIANQGDADVTGAVLHDDVPGFRVDPGTVGVALSSGGATASIDSTIADRVEATLDLPAGSSIRIFANIEATSIQQAHQHLARSVAYVTPDPAESRTDNNYATTDEVFWIDAAVTNEGNFVEQPALAADANFTLIADFDNDRVPDYLFASSTNTIEFANGQTTTLSGTITHAAIGDIDIDGVIDIVTTDSTSGVTVHLNDGAGNFTPTNQSFTNETTADNVFLADVDGDSDLDLFLSGPGREPSLWLHDADGEYTQSIAGTDEIGIEATWSQAADLDLDDDIDFAYLKSVPSFNNELVTWFNDGSGGFNAVGRVLTTGVTGLALGQVAPTNNPDETAPTPDGFPDALILTPTGFVISENNGLGNLDTSAWGLSLADMNLTNAPTDAHLIDLNADGIQDVLLGLSEGTTEAARWYEHDGAGTFTLGGSFTRSDTADTQQIIWGDTDGDEDVDLLIIDASGTHSHFTFNASPTIDGPSSAFLFGQENRTSDIEGLSVTDGDGDTLTLTIAAANSSQDSLTWDGTTSTSVTRAGTADELNALLDTFDTHIGFAARTDGDVSTYNVSLDDGTELVESSFDVAIFGAVDYGPGISIDGSLSTNDTTPVNLTGVTISDYEGDDMTIQVTVNTGTITYEGTDPVTITNITDGIEFTSGGYDASTILDELVYTPEVGRFGGGGFSVVYTATSSGGDNTGTLVVNVSETEYVVEINLPDELEAATDPATPYELSQDTTLTFTDMTLSDGNGDTESVLLSLTTDTGSLTAPFSSGQNVERSTRVRFHNIDFTDGDWTFTPTGDYIGLATLTFIALDYDAGKSATKTIYVNVVDDGITDVNDPAYFTRLGVYNYDFVDSGIPDGSSPYPLAEYAFDDDIFGTNTLNITGEHADFFEFDADTIYLKQGVDLSGFTSSDRLEIKLHLDDPSIDDALETNYFVAFVFDYSVPTWDIEDQTLTIDENSPAGTTVGQVTYTLGYVDGLYDDVKPGEYTLTGEHASLFSIDSAGTLSLADGFSLDYEDTPTYTLTITAAETDETGSADFGTIGVEQSATLTIEVGPINETPTLTVPTNFTTPEDSALNIPGITVDDPDGDELILTLSVTNGGLTLNNGTAGSTITITGLASTRNSTLTNDLAFTPATDFFGDATVTATLTDGEFTLQDTFTITVAPEDDPSLIGGDTTARLTEDTLTPATGTLVITDVDSTPSFPNVSGTTANGSYSMSNGTWTYTLDTTTVQSLDADDQITDTITFTATDNNTVEADLPRVGCTLLACNFLLFKTLRVLGRVSF